MVASSLLLRGDGHCVRVVTRLPRGTAAGKELRKSWTAADDRTGGIPYLPYPGWPSSPALQVPIGSSGRVAAKGPSCNSLIGVASRFVRASHRRTRGRAFGALVGPSSPPPALYVSAPRPD